MVNEDQLPRQFFDVKENDEKFIWLGEPKFLPFVATGIPFLLIGIAWGMFDYRAVVNISRQNFSLMIPFFALHTFPCWGSILNMFRLMLTHRNTFYAITNKRVMMKDGLWGDNFNAINRDKIIDSQITVNPLEKIMGVGTVCFFAGETDNRGLVLADKFVGIENPFEILKKVKIGGTNLKAD